MMDYAPEDIIRMEEEMGLLSLGEAVQQEKHNLDLFNLEVAKFRVEHGMSPYLIYLYVVMGQLSSKLGILEKDVAKVGEHWSFITDTFQAMKDKEE